MMRAAQFEQLAQAAIETLRPGEHLNVSLAAETSDFVRFNHAQVRQAGQVKQAMLTLALNDGVRQASLQLTLAGTAQDLAQVQAGVSQLRQLLPLIAPDPWLAPHTAPWEVRNLAPDNRADTLAVVNHVCAAAKGLDLVGILANGPVSRGFANSAGAFGWHDAYSLHLDWSLFHENGQAVKTSVAGPVWDPAAFDRQLARGREQLKYLGLPTVVVKPGCHRAYLAPAAMGELLGMLAWGGFSAQALASQASPLQKLYARQLSLNPAVTLREQVTGSLSPAFSSEGRPRHDVPLITAGQASGRLANSRSATEYGLPYNGADAGEAPVALDMAAGVLALAEVPAALDRGLYINNLWYLNYSDLPAARLTGLTRFATFWVEDGQIVGPVDTMRFDDSVYDLLGDKLLGLTQERELIVSSDTYEQRHTDSSRLPGALVSSLKLTL
ncbi:TldD/PmbA family protein [Pseudomonas sp. hsmgli-8]|uniref:TldD/PmbA family protein n=2 Tax=Pseudomonas TaxID=286 RepID=A0ABX0YBD8_9PSED|nr:MULTISPECIES: metallopeptidase TldD-related protein [Pseudomonas]MBF7142097.1 TldD/PmbA family protein [Pseudomonas sp. LY10J]NJP00635.1 TldD/PmbA family protein [Pseudomonas quercus]